LFVTQVKPDIDHGLTVIAMVLVSLVPLGTFLYSRDFEKRRWEESEFSPYATDDE
jgi:hypothetical protein